MKQKGKGCIGSKCVEKEKTLSATYSSTYITDTDMSSSNSSKRKKTKLKGKEKEEKKETIPYAETSRAAVLRTNKQLRDKALREAADHVRNMPIEQQLAFLRLSQVMPGLQLQKPKIDKMRLKIIYDMEKQNLKKEEIDEYILFKDIENPPSILQIGNLLKENVNYNDANIHITRFSNNYIYLNVLGVIYIFEIYIHYINKKYNFSIRFKKFVNDKLIKTFFKGDPKEFKYIENGDNKLELIEALIILKMIKYLKISNLIDKATYIYEKDYLSNIDNLLKNIRKRGYFKLILTTIRNQLNDTDKVTLDIYF
jgi:hypothetical protein